MKMNINKLIIGLLLTATACGIGGCHGDLDIMQDNKLSASNMWKDESDATSATYGVYNYYRSAIKSVHDSYLCWGELRTGLWGPGTHNTLNSTDQAQVRTSSMTSTNAYTNWAGFYTTINQANVILKHVPAMGLRESAHMFCMGNAYFMRAYCYFQLARIWGDVPMPLDGYESTDKEVFLDRTPVDMVLEQIGKDIVEAEKFITETSDKTVATPAAVKMLKADYALWMYRTRKGGDSYLTMASEAIQSLGISPAKIESNYADIFDSKKKCGKEVIFALHQDATETVNGPAYYLGWNESYIESSYRNNPVPITGGNQWWWYTPEYKALLTADPADTRAVLTCRTANYGLGGKEIGWTEKLMGYMNDKTRVFDSDFILYRYGEACLMDAEINYYQKDYAGALTALGLLTQRAYGSTSYYTDKSDEAVKQAIVDEYLKEMVGEGRTWWMMIRMDVIWDYNAEIESQRETNKNILLWPISQTTLGLNYKLSQTEGWF